MKSFTLTVPDEVNEKDLRMSVAAILFDQGAITSGQAAEMVAITKREFIQNVGNFGVSIFGETIDDLRTRVEI